MIPFVLIALIAVPLVIAGFLAMKRSRDRYEGARTTSAADEARMEEDFAEAERYEERWREQQRHPHRDDHL